MNRYLWLYLCPGHRFSRDIRLTPTDDTGLSVREEVPIGNGAKGTGADPMLSLSQTLSSPLPPVTANKDENLAAIAKDDGTGGFTSREALFGGDEQPEIKSASAPAWKTLITGWKGFSQLEIAQTYADPEHFSKAKLRTEFPAPGNSTNT